LASLNLEQHLALGLDALEGNMGTVALSEKSIYSGLDFGICLLQTCQERRKVFLQAFPSDHSDNDVFQRSPHVDKDVVNPCFRLELLSPSHTVILILKAFGLATSRFDLGVLEVVTIGAFCLSLSSEDGGEQLPVIWADGGGPFEMINVAKHSPVAHGSQNKLLIK